MIIRGNTIGTPLKPEKNLVKATDLTDEEKAQVRKNIGAVASVNNVKPDENGNVDVESDCYMVKVNFSIDEETGDEVYTTEDFNWEELVAAVKADKYVFCRVTDMAMKEDGYTTADDYAMLFFTDDDAYIDFSSPSSDRVVRITITSDGTVFFNSHRYHDGVVKKVNGTAPDKNGNVQIATGITKTLLWENASPKSQFNAQVIELTLTGCDEIEVLFQLSPSNSTLNTSVYAKVSCGGGGSLRGRAELTVSDTAHSSRIFMIYKTNLGVQFLGGYNGSTAANNYMVPLHIYGIKY